MSADAIPILVLMAVAVVISTLLSVISIVNTRAVGDSQIRIIKRLGMVLDEIKKNDARREIIKLDEIEHTLRTMRAAIQKDTVADGTTAKKQED